MRAFEGLMLIEKLLGERKSVQMLAMEIVDLLNERDKGYELTKFDKLVLGLRYSEFLATGDSDQDYFNASIKSNYYLSLLGIGELELYKEVEKLYGRELN